MNGSISFLFPHLAEPYSTPFLYFFASCFFMIKITFTAATAIVPANISLSLKLTKPFLNVSSMFVIRIIILSTLVSPWQYPYSHDILFAIRNIIKPGIVFFRIATLSREDSFCFIFSINPFIIPFLCFYFFLAVCAYV